MYQSFPAVPITPRPQTTPRLGPFLLIPGVRLSPISYGPRVGTWNIRTYYALWENIYLILTAVSPMATWRTQKEKLIYCIKKPSSFE